jgi:hypothetical protein
LYPEWNRFRLLNAIKTSSFAAALLIGCALAPPALGPDATGEILGSITLLRNRNMDAKNFFDFPDCRAGATAGACGPTPGLDRSQYGASFGRADPAR